MSYVSDNRYQAKHLKYITTFNPQNDLMREVHLAPHEATGT